MTLGYNLKLTTRKCRFFISDCGGFPLSSVVYIFFSSVFLLRSFSPFSVFFPFRRLSVFLMLATQRIKHEILKGISFVFYYNEEEIFTPGNCLSIFIDTDMNRNVLVCVYLSSLYVAETFYWTLFRHFDIGKWIDIIRKQKWKSNELFSLFDVNVFKYLNITASDLSTHICLEIKFDSLVRLSLSRWRIDKVEMYLFVWTTKIRMKNDATGYRIVSLI